LAFTDDVSRCIPSLKNFGAPLAQLAITVTFFTWLLLEWTLKFLWYLTQEEKHYEFIGNSYSFSAPVIFWSKLPLVKV
jgi:hypothetical protein